MSGSLNKVMLIGNLGSDPQIKSTQSGEKICNFNIATSERWRDRDGTQQEKTEWHRVVLFGKAAENAEKYLSKGRKVFIEGQLRTRKWMDQSNVERYTTEIVVSGFNGSFTILDNNRNDGGNAGGDDHYGDRNDRPANNKRDPFNAPSAKDNFDDDIPF